MDETRQRPTGPPGPPGTPSAGRPLTRVPGRVTLPPSITQPFDALTVPDQSASPGGEADAGDDHRPLLALFPAESRSGPSSVNPIPPQRATRRTDTASSPRAVERRASRDTEAGASRLPLAPYERFYGLREKPFALSADPRFFFHSTPHDHVNQEVLTAIREHQGLVVLTGEHGSGKTTLCRAVVEQLDRRTLTSFISDPSVSGPELLAKILIDFGVLSGDELARAGTASRRELSAALQSFVDASLAPLDATAIVIIDDAHDAPPDVLEEVRALCETADASSNLQVILVGEPPLAALLRQPSPLQQRVAVRCTLAPLPPEEVGAYITHRLSVAGATSAVDFNQSAEGRIFKLSRGVPRVVNLLCDQSLARACKAGTTTIDETIVDAAARDLDLVTRSGAGQRVGAQLVVAGAIAAFVMLGAAAAAWVFRDALARSIQTWKMVPPPPPAPSLKTPPPPARPTAP